MRVAIVNQHLMDALGGSEIQCDLIAAGLAKRGHEVGYVAPSETSHVDAEFSYSILKCNRSKKAIIGKLLDFRPDVVYWRFNKNGLRAVARAMSKAKVPFVFAASSVNDVRPWSLKRQESGRYGLGNVKRLMVSRWEHGGFRYVDALTVLNRDFLQCVSVSRQYYVPNAMVENIVSGFEWPRPYCVWVANIKPCKRPEAAVKLATALSSMGVDLIMVGYMQSPRYKWLEDPAHRPPNCYYLGPKSVEEVNSILAGSLLHVHTCEPEGFGNIFIQAWLQGRPSVSLGFDPCGYIESEQLGVNANDDFDAFVNAVQRFVKDQAERDATGERARAFALRTFSVDALIPRIEAILLEATGSGRAGR